MPCPCPVLQKKTCSPSPFLAETLQKGGGLGGFQRGLSDPYKTRGFRKMVKNVILAGFLATFFWGGGHFFLAQNAETPLFVVFGSLTPQNRGFYSLFWGFLKERFPDPCQRNGSRGGSGDTIKIGVWQPPLAEALKPIYLQGLSTLKAQNGPQTPILGWFGPKMGSKCREEKNVHNHHRKKNLLENFSGLEEKLSRPVVDTKTL